MSTTTTISSSSPSRRCSASDVNFLNAFPTFVRFERQKTGTILAGSVGRLLSRTHAHTRRLWRCQSLPQRSSAASPAEASRSTTRQSRSVRTEHYLRKRAQTHFSGLDYCQRFRVDAATLGDTVESYALNHNVTLISDKEIDKIWETVRRCCCLGTSS